MKKITFSDKIYIADSKIPNSGRGVFATKNIKKGELIERCPVIQIPTYDTENLNESYLINYIYYLGKKKDKMTLTLGFGSIYNHTYTPNATYRENLKEDVIDFVATKSIKKDEEITVNYNQGKTYKDPLWFE